MQGETWTERGQGHLAFHWHTARAFQTASNLRSAFPETLGARTKVSGNQDGATGATAHVASHFPYEAKPGGDSSSSSSGNDPFFSTKGRLGSQCQRVDLGESCQASASRSTWNPLSQKEFSVHMHRVSGVPSVNLPGMNPRFSGGLTDLAGTSIWNPPAEPTKRGGHVQHPCRRWRCVRERAR